MLMALLSAVLRPVIRRLGYVRKSEMAAAVAAVVAENDRVLIEKAKIEQDLRHKTRNLEAQIAYRARVEQEVGFLRELQLAHARKESGTQLAVDRLDTITHTLLQFMKDVWPEAYNLEPATPARAEESPTA